MADPTPPLVTLRRDDAAMLLTIADLYAPHEHGTGKLTPDVAPVAERAREAIQAAQKGAGTLSAAESQPAGDGTGRAPTRAHAQAEDRTWPLLPLDRDGLREIAGGVIADFARQPGPALRDRITDALWPLLEHAQSAAEGSHEGIRLWMLDCGLLVQKHREHAVEASARLGEQRVRAEAAEVKLAAGEELIREVLEAACRRDGLSLDSAAEPGEPARNYELAMRLGIGHVFGIGGGESGRG